MHMSLVIMKWLASLPVMLAVSEEVATPPVFETVKENAVDIWPWRIEPRSREVGDIDNAPGPIPVPERAATAMPPGVAVTVRVPALRPVVVGAKRTVTVQVPAGARAATQVFEATVKSAMSAPPRTTLGVPDMTPPVLVNVMVAVELLVVTTLP